MVISQKACENVCSIEKKFWGYNPYKGFFWRFFGVKKHSFWPGFVIIRKLAHASYQTTTGLPQK
jgi:hypothetical protein